ncbi:MAG: hypothetical protein ACTSWX_01650 [Promethearchaeota archaeon]
MENIKNTKTATKNRLNPFLQPGFNSFLELLTATTINRMKTRKFINPLIPIVK